MGQDAPADGAPRRLSLRDGAVGSRVIDRARPDALRASAVGLLKSGAAPATENYRAGRPPDVPPNLGAAGPTIAEDVHLVGNEAGCPELPCVFCVARDRVGSGRGDRCDRNDPSWDRGAGQDASECLDPRAGWADAAPGDVVGVADTVGQRTTVRLAIHAAIWCRLDIPSLVRMCCTWFCAVRSDR